MNNGRWQPDEDRYVRENVNKKTLEQMAEHLGRSALAVQLYMHRKHIVVGQTVKRNLVQEILRLKFRHPENFMPNRAFYQEVGINQMRWWDIFYGRKYKPRRIYRVVEVFRHNTGGGIRSASTLHI